MQFNLLHKLNQFSGVMTGAVLAGSFLTLAANPCLATTNHSACHSAYAYGAKVAVGSVVTVGPIAVAEFPSCYTQNTGSESATAGSVDASGLLSSGAVNSSASSTATSSTATSDVVGINLLDGVISGSEIKAVSTSFQQSNGTFATDGSASKFVSLKVLGLPIAANVAPNTVIQLPAIGTVTLNEQTVTTTSDKSTLTVNMIDVHINLGSNKGTRIIVASAMSEIRISSAPALVGGYAYAPELTTSAGLVTSGPLVLEEIPCFGTEGAVESDSVAGVNIPGVLSTGAVTVTGEGNLMGHETSAEATSSIAGINLLSGLVTATAINGVASASTLDGVNFTFEGGSTFVGLSVVGHPEITSTVAPNTHIKIANLGTLYFNKIEYYEDRIKVIPIDLEISTAALGLPLGATLTLGVVETQLHSATIP